jgi:hypothetical protein
MAHLDPDSKRFAILLREIANTALTPGDDDWKHGLSDDEVKIIEEENKKKKAERKIKPCAVKECKDTEIADTHATIESVTLRRKIEEIQLQLAASEEENIELEKVSSQAEEEASQAEIKLAQLKSYEKKELKEKTVIATRTKQSLDIAILKANAELSSHKDAEEKETREKEADARSRNSGTNNDNNINIIGNNFPNGQSLPPVNFDRDFIPKHAPKHTGSYNMTSSGFKQWSCCMADDHSQDGCQDDHSVGLLSTMVNNAEGAHHPYQIRKAEIKAALHEKNQLLHQPISCPPNMNKGFRDVRESHPNYSYWSRNHGGHASSLDLAQHAPGMQQQKSDSNIIDATTGKPIIKKQTGITTTPIKRPSTGSGRSVTSRSIRSSGGGIGGGGSLAQSQSQSQHVGFIDDNDGEGSRMGGSMDSSDSRDGNFDTARTSVIYLEASLARTNSILDKKKTRMVGSDRPSTAGAFPLTGSMRIMQKKITSGSFPVFSNIDLALEYNPANDMGVARSDIANSKVKQNMQVLDSASLLANYSSAVGKNTVGSQRHLGLSEMRRRGGRPLTSQKGPHLLVTSTVGRASSLAHMCQKQC